MLSLLHRRPDLLHWLNGHHLGADHHLDVVWRPLRVHPVRPFPPNGGVSWPEVLLHPPETNVGPALDENVDEGEDEAEEQPGVDDLDP